MKKILLILFIAPVFVSAQDTTIAQLSTKARLVQTFAPFVKQGEDTAYANLLIRWIKKFDVANPPSGTQLVVVDSIAVTVIAELYRVGMNFPQGSAAVGSDFAADIATIRAANSNLDRLLDAIDLKMANAVPNARTKGREILTGKKQ